jgi:tubby-related protein 1
MSTARDSSSEDDGFKVAPPKDEKPAEGSSSRRKSSHRDGRKASSRHRSHRKAREADEEETKQKQEDSDEQGDAVSPSTSPPPDRSTSPEPDSQRPATVGRSAAQRKALELQEKRKQRRANKESMVVSSEQQRPSTASAPSLQKNTVQSASADLLPGLASSPSGSGSAGAIRVAQTTTATGNALASKGIASSYDPNEDDSSDEELARGGDSPAPEVRVADTSDVRNFLHKPCPRGAAMIQCRIERSNTIDKFGYHTFSVYLDGSDQRFLLAARRRKKSRTSNYLLSLDKDDLLRHSGNYIGKVRSNFGGTEFVVYDKGDAPDKHIELPGGGELGLRQELASVIFAKNILGLKGPRKMKVLLPAQKDDDTRAVSKPTTDKESLIERWKKNSKDDTITLLTNKYPTRNEEAGAYVLNFHNRVKLPSVKNFQLVDPANEDEVLFQFGKVSNSEFSMDFRYPLCLMQAVGIALTSMDRKKLAE